MISEAKNLNINVVRVVEVRSKDDDCAIGENICFDEQSLVEYCLAEWKPEYFDFMLIAASVEYCDRSSRRSIREWSRNFHLIIPVHNPNLWNGDRVNSSLIKTLKLLTGDNWIIEFTERVKPFSPSRQSSLEIPIGVNAIVAFSDGMDSRAISAIAEDENKILLRVRLGTKSNDKQSRLKLPSLFKNIPYKIKRTHGRMVESSNRSRGFKFAVISSIAACLSNVRNIIIPESGQGALGPVLVPVGPIYPDYRNHPSFTKCMEELVLNALGSEVKYTFPRIWFTKGETLKASTLIEGREQEWKTTWSCWQDSRHSSVDGKKKQCGICAACLLRRQSIHAAGLTDDPSGYVVQNLSSPEFSLALPSGYEHRAKNLREYGIAAAMHLNYLAELGGYDNLPKSFAVQESKLAIALNEDVKLIDSKLRAMLKKHKDEWENFMTSLGDKSFIREWIQ